MLLLLSALTASLAAALAAALACGGRRLACDGSGGGGHLHGLALKERALLGEQLRRGQPLRKQAARTILAAALGRAPRGLLRVWRVEESLRDACRIDAHLGAAALLQ